MFKTSWKWPKLKWRCIQMRVSNLKDQCITADNQLRISGKQLAETEGLWTETWLWSPSWLRVSPVLWQWQALAEAASDKADRLDPDATARKPHPSLFTCHSALLWVFLSNSAIQTQSKAQWQVNKEGCDLSNSKGFQPSWLSAYWNHFMMISLFPEPYIQWTITRSLPAQLRITNPQGQLKEHRHFSKEF